MAEPSARRRGVTNRLGGPPSQHRQSASPARRARRRAAGLSRGPGLYPPSQAPASGVTDLPRHPAAATQAIPYTSHRNPRRSIASAVNPRRRGPRARREPAWLFRSTFPGIGTHDVGAEPNRGGQHPNLPMVRCSPAAQPCSRAGDHHSRRPSAGWAGSALIGPAIFVAMHEDRRNRAVGPQRIQVPCEHVLDRSIQSLGGNHERRRA